MAAAHRRGAGGVAAYFQYLAANGWTTDTSTMPKRMVTPFLQIETRMREFEDTPWVVTNPATDVR